MTRYLSSPLTIAGIAITLGGIFILLFSNGYYRMMGLSVFTMGFIVLATKWILGKSIHKSRERLTFEVFLFLLISVFALVIALDFAGIITMQNFIR